jgi:DNA-binding transcriptional regulator LsrR (DeoR family)
MGMLNPGEKKLLIKVAKLYYFEELTQAEIAKKIGVSRPIISKMLQKAKQSGIVEITIHDDTFDAVELEQRIEAAFGIDEALIVPTQGLTEEMLLPAVGKYCAAYLGKSLREVKRVGIGWGTTLFHLINEYPYENRGDISVIPLVGGMGTKRVELHSNHLAYELAKKIGGNSESLYAPAIVETVELKEQLVAVPNIASVLAQGNQVDVALVGIGTPYHASTMGEIGYLKEADIDTLRRSGVVGDINSRFIKADGTPADHPTNEKVIGTDLSELKKIPKVIGVAIGLHKAESILAVLRGGYVDVLITDEATATAIVRNIEA